MRGNRNCLSGFFLFAITVIARGATESSSVLHESRCGDYRLEWVGERPESEFDPRFGTLSIRIVSSSEGSLMFRPTGKLFFSDWGYEPCSPNAQWVVLLQDRYGPLHAVRYRNLWRYLEGNEPDQIIIGIEGDIAHVHSQIEWVGEQTLRFEIGGSPPIMRTITLP